MIHDDLGLGILFEVPEKEEASPVLKDLLFKSYELGINIKFTPITEERYNEWVSHQGKKRFIITLLSSKLKAEQISHVTKIISEQGLNIDNITRLSGRVALDQTNNTDRITSYNVCYTKLLRKYFSTSSAGFDDETFNNWQNSYNFV